MTQTPEKIQTNDAPSPAKTDDAKARMQRLSLKIAGYLYTIGDLSIFFAAKLKGKDSKKEALGGLTWFAGGVAAAVFGNEKDERKLRRMRRGLSLYLQEEGIDIPQESILSKKAIEKESHFYDKPLDLGYKKPSQMLNLSYAAGAGLMVYSGFDEKKGPTGKVNNALVARGVVVEAGALGGLLIKEYKTPPEKKPEGIIGKSVHWLREKPLRFPAIMYWINNGFLVKQIFDDKREYPGNKSYILSIVTLANYLVANALLLITPKEEVNKKVPLDITSLEKAAAEIVKSQPAEKQARLIQSIADFLSIQPEINRKGELVVQGIQAYLEGQPGKPPATASTPELAMAADISAASPTPWKEKVKSAVSLQPVAATPSF